MQKKLAILLVNWALFFVASGIQPINAQVFVAPTHSDNLLNSVTTKNGGVPNSSDDDVTINCDMLMHQSSRPIKAIAWDEGGASNMTHVYFEDFNGNQSTVQITGVRPDIVLGDSKDNPGVDYRAAVVYHDKVNNRPTINFYTLKHLGTSGFIAMFTGSVLLSGNASGTQGSPHIDMWSETSIPVGAYPRMALFAVTWEKNFRIYYNWGDINAGSTSMTVGQQVNFSGGGLQHYTDVACYTDDVTGNRYAAFSYTESPTGLVVSTLDFSTGTPFLSANRIFSGFAGAVFPRIEAMSQFSSSVVPSPVPWEAIASTTTACWVFNPGGQTDISSTLLSGGNFKSTAVAAALGPYYGSTVGNRIYTPGYLEWNNSVATPRYYARIVDGVSGGVGPDYYIINSGVVYGLPQYNLSDVSQSLALGSCSNSGDDLLSVWYDGADVGATGNIWYKLNSNVLPLQFKTTLVGNLSGASENNVYPNPALNEIHLDNIEGHYSIYSLSGTEVMQGTITGKHSIDIHSLSSGVYLLKTGFKTYSFTKQ